MDLLLSYLIFFMLFLLPYSSFAQNKSRVEVGTTITASDKAAPWLSPSHDFAFGFRKLDEKNLFLLSIWFYKIPDQTVVWYANEGIPVSAGSRVVLNPEMGLVLYDPQGNQLWKPNNLLKAVAYGSMSDTGNFMLLRSDSSPEWESFNFPTDTMLPTQIMQSGGILNSRKSENNFSPGRFQFRLLVDGNLVLNTRDAQSNMAYQAYYQSGTNDHSNSSNSGYQVVFNQMAQMYILSKNSQSIDLAPNSPPLVENYYHRATLNFDGVFGQYYHPKSSSENPGWNPVWQKPDNICLENTPTESGGTCGFNSICQLDINQRPICQCPQHYELLDPKDEYGSCKQIFSQSCEEDNSNYSAEDLYGFEELINIDWPNNDYVQMNPSTEMECKNSCLYDCFCAIATFDSGNCWKKRQPLANGRKYPKVNGILKVFLKYKKVDMLPQNKRRKDKGTLILVGSVLLGSSLFVNAILVAAFCMVFFLIYHKKINNFQNVDSDAGTNLRCFTYRGLQEATGGFKEELGRGSFGIVYKGQIVTGNTIKFVAVKRLDSVTRDREKNFKNEVKVIGQTHHKNLVRLLGFCDEGDNKLLVYEFLSNGNLASFLFGDTKLKWGQRTQIAIGIASGLQYLHEECIIQIIHCDIKPQNILLDDYYMARISDFGLAKTLMINQGQTSTGIRGTKGYVAPEWVKHKPITAKVDVYSFGVMLLEIICCRKNVEDLEVGREEIETLADWANGCFQQGTYNVLVENDVEALNDSNKLERFVKVALCCIQEDASLRPTMGEICQMLEGVVEVPIPNQVQENASPRPTTGEICQMLEGG